MKLLYTLNERPPKGITFFLALQHMLASVGGIVAVPLIVGGAIGLPPNEVVILISASLLVSGIATIAQCIGFGPVGIKLPVVMGSSFAFLGTLIGVGNMHGMSGIMGGVLVGSFVVIIASFYMDFVKKLFPTVVSGVVVTLIGLTILPVAMNWIGDAPAGDPSFASLPKLFLAAFSLTVVILVSVRCKGAIAAASIVIGLAVGYIAAMAMGMVDFDPLFDAAWLAAPEPFKYGMTFSIPAIITISLVYLVVVAEATGDFIALGNNCHKEVSGKDLKRGLLGDGIGSTLAAFMTAMPVASFSQNVGIVGISGVASRFVVSVSGVLLIIAGLSPKFGALAVTVPKPVLGGVGFVMFGMIAYAGIRMLVKATDSKRNALVVCVSLAAGMAVTLEPNLLQHFPEDLKMLFHSGIATGTIVAVTLNLFLSSLKLEDEDESEDTVTASVESPIMGERSYQTVDGK